MLAFDSGVSHLFQKEEKNNIFILFNEDWACLQVAISETKNLPINSGDFIERYGDFSEIESFNESLEALNKLREAMLSFGSPESLPSQLIDLSPGEDPGNKPKELYSKIVWIAFRISFLSKEIRNTLITLPDIAKIPDYDKRLLELNNLLNGPYGLHKQAEEMSIQVLELINDISKYISKFEKLNEGIADYISPSGPLYKSADSRLKSEQEELEKAQQDLKSNQNLLAWVGPLQRPQVVARINQIKKKISSINKKIDRTKLLQKDLTNWRISFSEITSILKKVVNDLAQVNECWFTQIKVFTTIKDQTTPLDLADMGAFSIEFKIDIAMSLWEEVSESTSIFTDFSVKIAGK